MNYSQRTFFKHIRLYDFVIKNAALNEEKLVRVPFAVPQLGQPLSLAQCHYEQKGEITLDDPQAASPKKDNFKTAGTATPRTKQSSKDKENVTIESHSQQSSRFQSENDAILRESHLTNKEKKVLFATSQKWHSRFEYASQKEPEPLNSQ